MPSSFEHRRRRHLAGQHLPEVVEAAQALTVSVIVMASPAEVHLFGGGVLVAQHAIQDLADRAHRQRVADFDLPRHLVLGQARRGSGRSDRRRSPSCPA